MSNPSTLLIAMPFGPLVTPSFALSLLKPLLEKEGIKNKILYPTINFAEIIGLNLYHHIASGLPRAHDLLGEFIFSNALFGNASIRPEIYFEYFKTIFNDRKRQTAEPEVLYLFNEIELKLPFLVNAANAFVDEVANNIIAMKPMVIGFSSVFQQNTASLALANRIKSKEENIKIILGGANCEGAMGLALFETFPFLDAVVSGEGEPVAVSVFKHFLEDTPLERIDGVHIRTKNRVQKSFSAGTKMVENMDSVSFPDYSDYIEAIKNKILPEPARLLFETSRGCWWGEKHHCTFCGLNGNTMKFRSKSPDIALDQLAHLAEIYPGYSICMTDNIIDNKYFKTFIPKIIEKNIKLELFYEMKANLKKEQILLLSQAGIRRIQPGIESLSTEILSLMKKGTTALQNIQILKWCKQYNVDPDWNLLWGFPFEPPTAYEKASKLIPLITHLKPPTGVGRIRLDRFSPNFRDSKSLFNNVKPFKAYSLVYPLDEVTLSRIAYFFDYDPPVNDYDYMIETKQQLNFWRNKNGKSFFFYVCIEEYVLIFDLRESIESPVISIITGLTAKIFLKGECISTADNFLSENKDENIDDIKKCLDELENGKIIATDGKYFLSLPVEGSAVYPGSHIWEILGNFHEKITSKDHLSTERTPIGTA